MVPVSKEHSAIIYDAMLLKIANIELLAHGTAFIIILLPIIECSVLKTCTLSFE